MNGFGFDQSNPLPINCNLCDFSLVETKMKILHDSCKRMHYSCRNLTRSCKNRFIITIFFQDFDVSYKILARIALVSQCFFHHTKRIRYFSKFFSTRRVSRRFRRRQEWSYPIGRDEETLDKNCFILYFYSDKLSQNKTYNFVKVLIPDAFKHVRLQNTFNRCKVH